MSFQDYWHILRRSWLVLLASTAAGILIALGLSAIATPVYQAQSQLFVSVHSTGGLNDTYTGGLYVQQRIQSYVPLVNSPGVLDPVVSALKLDTTASDLADQISVENPTDTVLLNVQVSDVDATKAAQISDATATALANEIQQLETTNAGEKPVRVELVRPAVVPTEPASPRTRLNVLVGALIGFLAGFAIAVLRTTMDSSIKTSEELEEATDGAVLGRVPADSSAAKNALVTSQNSPRAEAYRSIRTNLQYVDVDHPPKTVVITSCLPLEGKSTTAANLAMAVAQGGAKVLLVEADLRRPRVAEYLGVAVSGGLTNVLTKQTSINDAIISWRRGLLDVLPAGSVPPNPSELLASQQFAELLQDLSARYDTVIMDAPPLLPVTDAAIIASASDGAILIARYGKTSHDQARQASDALRRVNARLLGTILNFVPASKREHGYEHHYSAAQTPASAVTQQQADSTKTP